MYPFSCTFFLLVFVAHKVKITAVYMKEKLIVQVNLINRYYETQCLSNYAYYYWNKYCASIAMQKQRGLKNINGCQKLPVNPFIIVGYVLLISHFTNYIKSVGATDITPPTRTRHNHTLFTKIVWLIYIPVSKVHLGAGVLPYPVNSVLICNRYTPIHHPPPDTKMFCSKIYFYNRIALPY